MKEMDKIAIIIGAGPAGLTAAFELLEKTDIKPIIIEKSNYIGGISRTIDYNGNKIDIGGHRFFSKSTKIMDWWLNILPTENSDLSQRTMTYQNKRINIQLDDKNVDPEKENKVMLIRKRKSRIYFLRKFFNYPISISKDTLINLGIIRVLFITISYIYSKVKPIKSEKNLEDFFINRFGKKLYEIFFKSYTEKVWGIPCRDISADWGRQRIKGLSVTKAIKHFFKGLYKKENDIFQKKIETSLIEQFLYPKFGPGQMWEETAKIIKSKGGRILMENEVIGINSNDNNIIKVEIIDKHTKKKSYLKGDYFFSSMPVKHLVRSLNTDIPKEILNISEGLVYRDFITVGLLLNELKVKHNNERGNKLIKDNWIYIQEPDVLVGRLQIFNNWSPYMISDRNKVWIGLEYFCNKGDKIWNKSDMEMIRLAIFELDKIGIISKKDVIDSTVIKMEKTYPAYFGTYKYFNKLRKYLDTFENLFLVGRNGMHKYNNQDHSMLTAMEAVNNIINKITTKDNIWAVNTEQEYHEKN